MPAPAVALPDPDDVRAPKEYKHHFKTRKNVVTKFVEYAQHSAPHLEVVVLIGLSSPCEAAAKASTECMNRNDYQKHYCADFFEAYRDCKKSWTEKRRNDGLKGKDNRIDIKT